MSILLILNGIILEDNGEKRMYIIDYKRKHARFKIPRRSRCVGSSPTPGTMGKNRIIKAISSVVKPPTGGFFVPETY